MVEIFIERYKIDAPDDFTSAITYAIDDIRDFASRNTSFSKTIILPGTAGNRKVFGHIFDAGSSNFVNDSNPNVNYDFDASKAAACLIFIDNIQVFKGVLQLTKVVVDGKHLEFEANVLGELGGVIANISDKKLTDLDFSAYDHTFNTTNIFNSWSSALGSGYYYPLIDYGYSQDKFHFPIETFRPCLYLREYVEKILTNAGYSFTSGFFDTDYFKKIIIDFNGKFISTSVSTLMHGTNVSGVTFTDSPPSTNDIPLTMASTLLYYNSSTHTFVWRRSETVKVKCNISFNWTKPVTTARAFFVGIQNTATSTIEYFFNDVLTGTSGTVSNKSFVMDLEPNVEYKLVVGHPDTSGTAGNDTITNVDLLISGQPNVDIPLYVGDTVIVNNCIPRDIFQLDLLKWIIQMFNLYVTEDREKTNHINIEPYIDFYDTDYSHVENWDGKLDRDKSFSYSLMGEMNSRTYEFKFKDDSDYYNKLYTDQWHEGYGSRIYDTGKQFAKDKHTVEVGFSPSPLVQFSGYDRVMPVIAARDNAGVWSSVAHNPRILFRSTAAVACQPYLVEYYDMSSGILQGVSKSEYGYAGHLDDIDAPANDLNFGAPKDFFFTLATGYLSANLFNVFWSSYIFEITDKDSKLLEASFKLFPYDIYNLDFSKAKYINGQLWRLNKIIDYSTGNNDTTKCELIKVIDLVQ